MFEPLQNIESPVFFSLSGNPTSAEVLAELNRLKSQQSQLKAQIVNARDVKEAIGAALIRSKQTGDQDDFSNMEYDLNGQVSEYYRLQSQYDEITKEIARVHVLYNSNNDTVYRNVTGATPEVFDWIAGQTFHTKLGGNINLTGIHSVKDHDLKIGNYITLVSNNPRYNGDFMVRSIGDDGGTYQESIFDIEVVINQGETASGTWQLSSYAHPKVDTTMGGFVKNIDPVTQVVTYQYVANVQTLPNYFKQTDAASGQVYYTLKGTVVHDPANDIITPTKNTITIGGVELPSWAIWVGGALVAGLVIFIVIRNFKKIKSE